MNETNVIGLTGSDECHRKSGGSIMVGGEGHRRRYGDGGHRKPLDRTESGRIRPALLYECRLVRSKSELVTAMLLGMQVYIVDDTVGRKGYAP